jgi:PKD repeat protein
MMWACDRSPLLAPTDTTITLFAGNSVVPLNGTTELFATVIESAGTPVQNGTLVRFTTDLGTLDPAEARTHGGQATARLQAGSSSGTATVSAISGSARATDVMIQIGGAVATNLVVSANPPTVPATGGTIEITAIVSDASGNRVSGVLVAFGTTAGQLANQSVATNANGEARTRLTTNRDATVTASVSGLQQSVNVQVESAPTIAVTTQTALPTVGQPTTFAVTIGQGTNGSAIQQVTIDFGDGQSQALGALVGTLSVVHTYATPGSFVVTVTAVDVAGGVSSVSTTVAVSVTAVGVVVTASPTNPATNAVVSLTATVTPATTGVVSYSWDFGDGQTAVTTGNQTTHVYSAAGLRVVRVTAQTVDGTQVTGQTEVAVGLTTGAVTVSITASPTNPGVNTVVSFTATVTPATTPIVRFEWSFGDGTTAVTSGNQINHVYAVDGPRTIQVTAVAADGQRISTVTSVLVGM